MAEVRYCGVRCQKAHWKEHKLHCGRNQLLLSEMLGTQLPLHRRKHVRQIRWLMRRCWPLLEPEGPIVWAVRQAFLFSDASPRSTAIVFTLIRHNKNANSILLPIKIEFVPLDSPQLGSELLCHYKLQWSTTSPVYEGTWPLATGSCILENGVERREEAQLSPRFPYWLYVFFQCCIAGDFHPRMARIRLELLVDAFRQLGEPEPHHFTEFKLDHFDEWEYEPSREASFLRWKHMVEPVVNLL